MWQGMEPGSLRFEQQQENGDPKMQRNSRCFTFNLIEVSIALIVLMVGVVGVMSAIPKGMQSNQESVSRLCAADTADQFLNFFATEIHKDWETRKCIPLNQQDVDERDTAIFCTNGLIARDNMSLEFQANSELDEWDPAAHTDGVFRVTQKTHTNGVDFRGIVRIWRENIDDAGDDDPSSIRLHAEISWPPEMPYSDRKKSKYTMLIAHERQVYATVAGTPAQPDSEIIGTININPANNSHFEFNMVTPSGEITRDTLHAADNTYTYTGSATYIRFKPKGNGNQNSLIVDGETYYVENKNVYEIRGDDLQVHLYNSKAGSGNAMGKWYVDISLSRGTVSLEGEGDIEEEEGDNGIFTVSGGEVILSVDGTPTFTVLGCSLSQGNNSCPVTSAIVIDGATNTPFGSPTDPNAGNINDGNTHSFSPGELTADTEMSATAWAYRPNGQLTMQQSSTPGNQNVLVLVDGDSVAAGSAESHLSGYFNGGTVSLEDNQVLFLFELGTTNLGSSEADFQDLAILLTVD